MDAADRSLAGKARRYLSEGRVLVAACGSGYVEASVRGTLGTYRVFHEDARWRCSCPARVPECAHVIAVALVTDPRGSVIAAQHESPQQATRRARDSDSAAAQRRADPRARHLRRGDTFKFAGSDRVRTVAHATTRPNGMVEVAFMPTGGIVVHGNSRVVLIGEGGRDG